MFAIQEVLPLKFYVYILFPTSYLTRSCSSGRFIYVFQFNIWAQIKQNNQAWDHEKGIEINGVSKLFAVGIVRSKITKD
jgi:hypothetical protein